MKYRMRKLYISYDDGIYTLNRNMFVKVGKEIFLIKKGFAWNGSSHSIDSKYSIRSSLYHDFFCKTGKISRPVADKLYRDTCIEDGMSKVRAYARWMAIVFYRKLKEEL